MTPLKLTDTELDIVFAAARPLAVPDRDPKVCPSCKSPYWDRPRRSEAKSTKKALREVSTCLVWLARLRKLRQLREDALGLEGADYLRKLGMQINDAGKRQHKSESRHGFAGGRCWRFRIIHPIHDKL
jgi:hypothetical protein